MKIFTFSYGSQYMDGFYQAIAEDEERARELLSVYHPSRWMELVSCFLAPSNEDERIVYAREIDNPAYEG